MYHLFGFHTLNVWVYECASIIHTAIAVKEANGISSICNWKVIAAKPKFEMFMKIIFIDGIKI